MLCQSSYHTEYRHGFLISPFIGKNPGLNEDQTHFPDSFPVTDRQSDLLITDTYRIITPLLNIMYPLRAQGCDFSVDKMSSFNVFKKAKTQRQFIANIIFFDHIVINRKVEHVQEERFIETLIVEER